MMQRTLNRPPNGKENTQPAFTGSRQNQGIPVDPPLTKKMDVGELDGTSMEQHSQCQDLWKWAMKQAGLLCGMIQCQQLCCARFTDVRATTTLTHGKEKDKQRSRDINVDNTSKPGNPRRPAIDKENGDVREIDGAQHSQCQDLWKCAGNDDTEPTEKKKTSSVHGITSKPGNPRRPAIDKKNGDVEGIDGRAWNNIHVSGSLKVGNETSGVAVWNDTVSAAMLGAFTDVRVTTTRLNRRERKRQAAFMGFKRGQHVKTRESRRPAIDKKKWGRRGDRWGTTFTVSGSLKVGDETSGVAVWNVTVSAAMLGAFTDVRATTTLNRSPTGKKKTSSVHGIGDRWGTTFTVSGSLKVGNETSGVAVWNDTVSAAMLCALHRCAGNDDTEPTEKKKTSSVHGITSKPGNPVDPPLTKKKWGRRGDRWDEHGTTFTVSGSLELCWARFIACAGDTEPTEKKKTHAAFTGLSAAMLGAFTDVRATTTLNRRKRKRQAAFTGFKRGQHVKTRESRRPAIDQKNGDVQEIDGASMEQHSQCQDL
ncbi:hypothetical protein BC829DRAFT_475568 [Chytridium lagenaria]|nr:hypothetical protein BC829DRAFT_475568 [Chytridium lagenaria]